MASVPTISAESFDFEAWVLLENFGWDILGEFGYNFKAKGYNKYDNLLKLTEDDLKEMNCDDDRFRKRLLLAIKRLAEGLQSVAYGLLSAQLYIACGKGDLAAVKELEAKGANLHWRTPSQDYCYTTLHRAAEGNHVDVIKYLLDNGAHINECSNIYCHTPLASAARDGSIEAVKFLYENGAYVHKNSSRDDSPLSSPAFFNRMHVVQYMLELPEVDVNATKKDGEGVLHHVDSMELPMLKLLINAGAKIFPDKRGVSPVHKVAQCERTYLSYKRNLEAIVILVKEGGADIQQSTLDDLTALHIAARKGSLEMVQTLIQLGAHIKRLAGKTPLDLAQQKGHTEVVEYLNSLPEAQELLEKEKQEAEREAEKKEAERERLRIAAEEAEKKRGQWLPTNKRQRQVIVLLLVVGLTYLLRNY